MKKLSRKVKKRLYGCKKSRAYLYKKFQELEIVKYPKTIFQAYESNMTMFCPNCGHEDGYGVDRGAVYPELWEDYYCCKCDCFIGHIDNSPFGHVLAELKDDECARGHIFSKYEFEKRIKVLR
jgi:hypothetical protein